MFLTPQHVVWEVACRNSYPPRMLSQQIEIPSCSSTERCSRSCLFPIRDSSSPAERCLKFPLSPVGLYTPRLLYLQHIEIPSSPPVNISEVLVRWFCYPHKSARSEFLFPRSWWWILILSMVNISCRRSTVFLSLAMWRLLPKGRLLLYTLQIMRLVVSPHRASGVARISPLEVSLYLIYFPAKSCIITFASSKCVISINLGMLLHKKKSSMHQPTSQLSWFLCRGP